MGDNDDATEQAIVRADRRDKIVGVAHATLDAALAAAATVFPVLAGPALLVGFGVRTGDAMFGAGAGARAAKAQLDAFDKKLREELDRVRAVLAKQAAQLREQGERIDELELNQQLLQSLAGSVAEAVLTTADPLKFDALARAIAIATAQGLDNAPANHALVRELAEMEPLGLRVLLRMRSGRASSANMLSESMGLGPGVIARALSGLAQKALVEPNGNTRGHERVRTTGAVAPGVTVAITELAQEILALAFDDAKADPRE